MSRRIRDVWRLMAAVFVDPVEAFRAAARMPSPWPLLIGFAGTIVGLGLATVPRQLAFLGTSLPATGDPIMDAQQVALREVVTRLIVIDRLVPAPTVLMAAGLLFVVAEPVLMLARDRRRALVVVVALGLAPLIVERIGELAITHILLATSQPLPADVIRAPHRFVTGPLLLWKGPGPAPGWLEMLDARVNLVSLWCLAQWSVGLRALDGKPWSPWHVALPAGCLAAAGLATWVLAPIVLPLLLSW